MERVATLPVGVFFSLPERPGPQGPGEPRTLEDSCLEPGSKAEI